MGQEIEIEIRCIFKTSILETPKSSILGNEKPLTFRFKLDQKQKYE